MSEPKFVTNTPRASDPPGTIRNIDELLTERGKTHGDYSEHADITQRTKDLWRSYESGWARLNYPQRETLDMIAHKVGRILAGNPNVKDHWDDTAGYARLVSQLLELIQRPKPMTPSDPHRPTLKLSDPIPPVRSEHRVGKAQERT